MKKAFLVLESGHCYPGQWHGGPARAGEVVFNTSHSGYEEIATDPSYFNQIMVMTAPQQGNYQVDDNVWESKAIHIRGFICLDLQKSEKNSAWMQRLIENQVPVVDQIQTRELVMRLREEGTPWGALVEANSEAEARDMAKPLIEEAKSLPRDWPHLVSRSEPEHFVGQKKSGPKVAVLDFGAKENIIRELRSRCSELKVFPSRTPAEDIRAYDPDGIMLTNGPGDPSDVEVAVDTIKELVGWKPIFGICMGHQLLALALGAKTSKLKFGHRGSNHPIRDTVLDKIYMTSQNHGYVVEPESLPDQVTVTHTNLNDGTVAGLTWNQKKLLSVQFHPESHPGPNDSVKLFDQFVESLS